VAATADQIRAAVAAYFDRFNAHDRAGYLGLYAPDATLEDPVGSEVRHGRESIGEFWDTVQSMTENVTLVPIGEPCIAAGEVAFKFSIINVLGGQKYAMDAIDVMTFDDDGAITSMRAYWDAADMRPIDA
jgi:steroid delta-isomerase